MHLRDNRRRRASRELLIQFCQAGVFRIFLDRAFELLRQHTADLWVGTRSIGELLERPERLDHLARFRHPLGVLDEVLSCLGAEPTQQHEFSQHEIRGCASRRVSQDLVAESDGVVGKPRIHVPVRRPLVHLHRGIDLIDLEIQVADFVVDGKLVVHVGRALEPLDDLEVDIDGFRGLILQLELASLVLEPVNVQCQWSDLN